MSDISNEKRDALIRKIKALQNKTEANGCTESEAMAAMALASQLIEEYELEADVNAATTDDEGAMHSHINNEFNGKDHPARHCIWSIERLTETKIYHSGRSGRTNRSGKCEIHFIGTPADCAAAEWLFTTIRAAMDKEWVMFYMSALSDGKTAVKGYNAREQFMAGMARRIQERIEEITAARDAARGLHRGQAIVVAKKALIQKLMERENIQIASGWSNRLGGDLYDSDGFDYARAVILPPDAWREYLIDFSIFSTNGEKDANT